MVLGWQGWRVAFIGIGSLSVLVGLFAACTMTEPERETSGMVSKDRGALRPAFWSWSRLSLGRQELKKLLSYFRMPTFCAAWCHLMACKPPTCHSDQLYAIFASCLACGCKVRSKC